MKDFAESFYKGRDWRKCRSSFIAYRVSVDGGLCMKCHENLGFIVHHTVELNANNIHVPEIALNHRLLEYVCLECHNKIHGHFEASRKCLFDAEGNVVGVG